MSALAGKLMGNTFYGRMIAGLYRLPANAQEWIKRMQEMFNETVCSNPWALCHVPGHFKTEEICERAVDACPLQLKYVPDHFKNKK